MTDAPVSNVIVWVVTQGVLGITTVALAFTVRALFKKLQETNDKMFVSAVEQAKLNERLIMVLTKYAQKVGGDL